MDEMKAVLNNAIALVKDPVAYMKKNKEQAISVNSLMINYVAILALVPLVGRILGDLIYYTHGRDAVGYAIAGAIVSYFLDIISVFIIGYVIWKLAPSFKTTATQAKSTMLAAFVFTPVFLIGILSIIPVLGYLAILGLLYGLYILYKGLPIVLNTPVDRTVTYVIAVLVVSIIIMAIISVILGGLDAAAVPKPTLPPIIPVSTP
jgi:Yip1 domain